jgi:predicted ATPase/DNA-binding SARP family transcriptional activator
MDARPLIIPPSLHAHVLGPVRIAVGTSVITEHMWQRRAARSLLLLLLITPGHRLPRDQVLDALWPTSSPETAYSALRKVVHALRRVLEPDLLAGRASAYLEAERQAIALRHDIALWIDIDAFERELERARSLRPDEQRRRLRQALALYRGDLLAEDPYLEWAAPRRQHLRELRRRAALTLADLDVAAGEPAASVPHLEPLVQAEPTDEVVLCTLMRALAQAGQRDDALRWYQRGVHRLHVELDTEPDAATRQLAAELEALVSAPPLPRGVLRIRSPVPPPPNALVGRSRELEHLQDLLLNPDVRLVTVTGPGGVGKTRLAQEVARQVGDEFADGVCYVPLATVTNPAQVLPTIARALGLPEIGNASPLEAVTAALLERELLLVLDNLEQVIDVRAELATLLDVGDGLTVLGTTREPLHLRAERLFETPPLSAPRPGQHVKASVRNDAVALFAERARAVSSGFAVTSENIHTVATICASLDGLPLAIELAAARSRTMSPQMILERLNDRFALLAGGYHDLPPRQRTMRDAIAWSYDLLTPTGQVLFRRLAVFAGGFTLEAAEEICLAVGDPDLEIAEGVWSLVDQSLLFRQEDDAGLRYSMLETVREFGLEHLAASREEEAVRQAHAAHFVALAASLRPQIEGTEGPTALARLESEYPNLRAGLTWAVERGDAELALRFVAALWKFWWVRRYLSDGRAWSERVLALPGDELPVLRSEARYAAGSLALGQDDYAVAQLHGEAGLALASQIDDPLWTAMHLFLLGRVAQFRGEYGEARSRYEPALAIYRDLGRTRLSFGWHGVAMVLASLGAVAYGEGDFDEAIAHNAEALTIWRERGDPWGQGIALINLGAVAASQDDLGEAAARYRESIACYQTTADRAGIGGGVAGLALVAALAGLPERAARLFGAAEALREVAAGRALTPPQAVAEAITAMDDLAR